MSNNNIIAKYLNNKFSLRKMVNSPNICLLGNNKTKLDNITKCLVKHFYKKSTRKIYLLTNETDFVFDVNIKTKFYPPTELNIKKILSKQLSAVRDSVIIINYDIDIQTIMSMECMKYIILNGRHYHLSCILKVNNYFEFTAEQRINFDYFYIAGADKSIHKKIYENYLSIFPTSSIPYRLLKYTNHTKRCMIVDNRKPSFILFDKIYFYDVIECKINENALMEDNFDYIDGLCNDTIGYTSRSHIIEV
ncbi:virion packaging ATPase [Tupanvirus soda lake]|uniref:Virion packaging ATPase n=2 Tax=Tupanvirus TaxID=2094720 RepID=A0A6N1NYN3_9VIRU|nr:virion packaging ATPase [Tupanvirus soda lake]QKU35142.1 virion packaging ATPase [Tupanvirus soda lake]